ncbi:hypothetical protein DY000_02016044 [Brassica cretica]|uniref:Uncharacterized protein n=1 Tax=Brassica cretica TaxID=69181 RepID=A0ABQ7DBC9_BRACR|nr:hypothetical protein DY000_02016044 [Brassica cretica]
MPTESTSSCNAVKILTHEEFAAKHPHPPSPDNVRIDQHTNNNVDRHSEANIDRYPSPPIDRRAHITYQGRIEEEEVNYIGGAGFQGNQGGNRNSYGNRMVKEKKLQEGDFEVESLMSFGGSHWCRSTPTTEHRSTYTNQDRSTSVPEYRSTTPTESTASCNAVKILTHEEFAEKHPHPPSHNV